MLYLSNPPGIDAAARRRMLDGMGQLNEMAAKTFGDPEINTRIAQYEMAFRMQSSMPELTDLSGESKATIDLYGIKDDGVDRRLRPQLLGRATAERGVRFIQLMHRGWDQHSSLPGRSAASARTSTSRRRADQGPQASAACSTRRSSCGAASSAARSTARRTDGRQLRPRPPPRRCFTMWAAGGGIRGGVTYGETDDYCYNVVKDPVHVHDFNATVLRCLGIDHERLTYKVPGPRLRLHRRAGHVVKGLLA